MLPLLRILPAAGVLLSLLILLLAATPPRGSGLPRSPVPARGPLIDAAEHPEWRQFILQAAYRRADEVGRLRDLRDTPVRTSARAEVAEPVPEPALTDVAPALNIDPMPPPSSDSPPHTFVSVRARSEETVPESRMPTASVPVAIGKTSAIEIPAVLPRARPTLKGKTVRSKSRVARIAGKPKRAAQAAAQQPAQRIGIFDLMKNNSSY